MATRMVHGVDVVYVTPPQFDNVTCETGLNELQQANPDGTGYCRVAETEPEPVWNIPKPH